MRLSLPGLVFAVLAMTLVACDRSPNSALVSSDNAPEPADAVTPEASEAKAQAQHDAQQQKLLSLRLTALDYFSERMWPGHDGEAGINWLRTSAAGSGLELTRVMPEVVIKRAGVAVRPVTVQAEGDWGDVVEWLRAIEASPRRLVLREVGLHTLRNRVVADLKIAVLIDRPTGLDELATMNVADLRGEELDRAVQVIETELRGKSQTLNQLGADASWSQPIAELTALLPDTARPVNLSLVRTGNAERAQQFTGRFTLVVPDAGDVPTYVRSLQKRPGFAAAGLESLREAGADWQRAAVTFTFTGEAGPISTSPSGMAEVDPETP